MKRFILILLVCAMLVGCLAACDNLSDNAFNQSEEPKGTVITKETHAYLLEALNTYLEEFRTEYDMPPKSMEYQIGKIEYGAQPIFVEVDPSRFYFVCGYYNPDHKYEDQETNRYCCSNKYTWVQYEKASDIADNYNGQDIMVAFQINLTSTVINLLPEKSQIKNAEHFQIFETKFVDGKNTNEAITFSDQFIYINSKYNKDRDVIYHSVFAYHHEWSAFLCVKLDGKSYIKVYSHTSYIDGVVEGNYRLKDDLGEYFDELSEIMIKDKYSETNDSGYTSHYVLFDIDEFVDTVLK